MYRDCDRARRWASADLDGELSDFEHALLEDHLRRCAACVEFRAGIAGITRELRAVPPDPFDGVIESFRGRRRFRLRIGPAVAAMAVGAVGLGSLLASSDIRPEPAVSAPTQFGVAAAPGSSLTSGPTNLRMRSAVARLGEVRARITNSQAPRLGGPVLREP